MFYTNWQASIVINDKSIPILPLLPISFPQKSPLFLTLCLIFNGNLVQIIINKNQGVITFINNYLAWIISSTIEKIEKKLLNKIISYIERWALENRSNF